MEKKGKPVLELQSQEWLRDLAFLVDITEHLNNLNKMLQGRKKVVTQFSDNIHAFKLKLTLWEMQLANGNPALILSVSTTRVPQINSPGC